MKELGRTSKKTVLFVAEAVTLAHFGRIMTLARALDENLYNIVVASDPRYLGLEQPFPFRFEPIWTIPGEDFAHSLAKGKAVYDTRTLERYVEDDLELLKRIKPDVVIGDFRLSLAVSAPLLKVPYITIVNAYWSPFADIQYPVPDIPLTRLMGLKLGQLIFNVARPVAFALHARPLNTVRRRYGLDSVGASVPNAYSWADHVFYADTPGFITLSEQPANHHWLGPVLWSTKTALPDWWLELPRDKPIVFVSPGSSGQSDSLALVLRALSDLPINIIAATAGRVDLPGGADNVFVADYLPFDQAVEISSLIICNGGSLTTYQALAEAVPVLGLTTNMDQLLNMKAIERQGAGICLRNQLVKREDVYDATQDLLYKAAYKLAAKRIAGLLAEEINCQERFATLLGEILS